MQKTCNCKNLAVYCFMSNDFLTKISEADCENCIWLLQSGREYLKRLDKDFCRQLKILTDIRKEFLQTYRVAEKRLAGLANIIAEFEAIYKFVRKLD